MDINGTFWAIIGDFSLFPTVAVHGQDGGPAGIPDDDLPPRQKGLPSRNPDVGGAASVLHCNPRKVFSGRLKIHRNIHKK